MPSNLKVIMTLLLVIAFIMLIGIVFSIILHGVNFMKELLGNKQRPEDDKGISQCKRIFQENMRWAKDELGIDLDCHSGSTPITLAALQKVWSNIYLESLKMRNSETTKSRDVT
jgi:hypothetical protein